MIKVKCLECNEILVSILIHDFQQCNCSNKAFADSAMIGTKENGRYGGKDLNRVEVLD